MKLLNKIFLTCKKATELIEKETVFSLTKVEKIKLFFHKQMCESCTKFASQSKLIDTILSWPNKTEDNLTKEDEMKISVLKKEISKKIKK